MVTPKAIFVSAFDSAPLAPDYEVILNGEEKNLQTGFDCLKKLCNKNINLQLWAGAWLWQIRYQYRGNVTDKYPQSYVVWSIEHIL